MKSVSRLLCAISAASLPLVLGACDEGSSAPGPVTTSVETQDANGAVTDEFSSGQQINFVLKVHNTSEYPVTFDAPSCSPTGQASARVEASYLVVNQGTTNEVSDGGAGNDVCPLGSFQATPVDIQPGQTVTFNFNWNQMVTGNQLVQPGNYSVVAGLICSGPGSGYCMPNFSTALVAADLTQSYYRSGPADFTIKP